MNSFSLELTATTNDRLDDEHLRVNLCTAYGDATAHAISTHSASHLERIRFRCQAWSLTVSCLDTPFLDQRTIRVGRWPHGNLDTSDDRLVLAIATYFFALTTGAMDVTVNALSLWGPRPWPLKPSTPQRPFNTSTIVWKRAPWWCRRNVPTFGNPAQTGPPHGIAERPERH